MAIILLACEPCVVIVNCWDRFCTMGRAPRTKETLPDFHERCRVTTRHPRVFRGLTGCQRIPGFGASQIFVKLSIITLLLFSTSLCFIFIPLCFFFLKLNNKIPNFDDYFQIRIN